MGLKGVRVNGEDYQFDYRYLENKPVGLPDFSADADDNKVLAVAYDDIAWQDICNLPGGVPSIPSSGTMIENERLVLTVINETQYDWADVNETIDQRIGDKIVDMLGLPGSSGQILVSDGSSLSDTTWTTFEYAMMNCLSEQFLEYGDDPDYACDGGEGERSICVYDSGFLYGAAVPTVDCSHQGYVLRVKNGSAALEWVNVSSLFDAEGVANAVLTTDGAGFPSHVSGEGFLHVSEDGVTVVGIDEAFEKTDLTRQSYNYNGYILGLEDDKPKWIENNGGHELLCSSNGQIYWGDKYEEVYSAVSLDGVVEHSIGEPEYDNSIVAFSTGVDPDWKTMPQLLAGMSGYDDNGTNILVGDTHGVHWKSQDSLGLDSLGLDWETMRRLLADMPGYEDNGINILVGDTYGIHWDRPEYLSGFFGD